jgi:uncharacterized protein
MISSKRFKKPGATIDLPPKTDTVAARTMLDVIEKLLVLQDRDRHILRVKSELAQIGPQRHAMQSRMESTQTGLETAKLKGKQIESERKRLELEVETKKQQIERYSVQQFQTKKNEEFRALAHEIEVCKADIFKLEDKQLELMEQAEVAQKEVATATQVANEARKLVESNIAGLGEREENLKKELADLEANRHELAAAVDESTLSRYERLLKNKGASVVVGIERGVCGGCHMKFPLQLVVSCQAQQEVITCPNCGRILYYSPEMDLAVSE